MQTHPPDALALMRASHMQANVVALPNLGLDAAAEVRDRCAVAVAKINTAPKSAWLPLELDVELSDCVEDVCGRSGLEQWCRDAIVESTRGSLLGPLLDGLVRLGLGPEHAIRRIPKGWDLIYRGCGALRCVDSTLSSATLRLSEPSEQIAKGSYPAGIAAAFEGVVLAIGGESVNSEVSVTRREIGFELRWVSGSRER